MADASKIILTEGDAPGTPSAGYTILYPKTDKKWYYKGDNAVEVSLQGSSGTSGSSGASGTSGSSGASGSSGTSGGSGSSGTSGSGSSGTSGTSGSGISGASTDYASVSTTNATPTTLWTAVLTDDRVYSLQAHVAARCTGGAGGNLGKGAIFTFEGMFRRASGGSVTMIGSVDPVNFSTDVVGWAAVWLISGTSLTISVTGAATDNLNWGVTLLIINV